MEREKQPGWPKKEEFDKGKVKRCPCEPCTKRRKICSCKACRVWRGAEFELAGGALPLPSPDVGTVPDAINAVLFPSPEAMITPVRHPSDSIKQVEVVQVRRSEPSPMPVELVTPAVIVTDTTVSEVRSLPRNSKGRFLPGKKPPAPDKRNVDVMTHCGDGQGNWCWKYAQWLAQPPDERTSRKRPHSYNCPATTMNEKPLSGEGEARRVKRRAEQAEAEAAEQAAAEAHKLAQ